MNKKLVAIVWILSSIALFILTSWIGSFDHKLKFVTVLFAYLVFTYFTLDKWKVHTSVAILTIILPILLLLLNHISNWSATSLGHLSTLAYFIGMSAGFCFFISKRRMRAAIVISGVFTCVFVHTWAYDKYLFYTSYNSFNGLVNESVPRFSLATRIQTLWTLEKQEKKFVVFDFWNSLCGVCYKKFPKLDRLHKKFNAHPEVGFYAVNVPILNEKPSDNLKLLDEFNYTFPILYAADTSTVKQFKVEWYPTVLILKKGEGIVYRGDIENVEAALFKLGLKL